MNKVIYQFGFNVQEPPEHVPVVDCRQIPNPYRLPTPEAQRLAVRGHRVFHSLVAEALQLLRENKAIGIGCGYGKHRSGEVVAEVLSRYQQETGCVVGVIRMGRK